MRKLVFPKTLPDLINPARREDLKEGIRILNVLQRLRLVINSGGQSSESSIQVSGSAALLTGSANLSVTASWLIVAGGGSGGARIGAGGGAGGVLSSDDYPPVTLSTANRYEIVVGYGGPAVTASPPNVSKAGISGGNSSAFGRTAYGGGGGAAYTLGGGQSGGSGGGAAYGFPVVGSGVAGQGNDGGPGSGLIPASGGGGGAGAVGGGAGTGPVGGAGGAGRFSNISGTPTYYGGGGGGAGSDPGDGGAGGLGGGGGGVGGNVTPAGSGTANTGGGGGGTRGLTDTIVTTSGAGGTGVVIIRYPGPPRFRGGNIITSDGDTIHTFTETGTLSPR